MKCGGETCSLQGVTDFGVGYSVGYKYTEGRIFDEAIEIHRSINEYLQKKIVIPNKNK